MQSSLIHTVEFLSEDERSVLGLLLRRSEMSRSEVASALGFSKTKSNSLVSSLLAMGLLAEGGAHVGTRGRNAVSVELRRDLAYVVGVDLGATSVDVGLADSHRRLLSSRSEPLDVKEGPTTCLSKIVSMVQEMSTDAQIDLDDVIALGLGVPGPVEFRTGLLISPPLMPDWEGYSIRDHLADELGCTVFVDNDVNVMALGESWNHTESFTDAIFVKIGTGIGSGILCSGEIYRGADGSAGDIGHICVDPEGPVCHCGNVGCLEALAAAPAITRRAVEAATHEESDLLANLLRASGTLTSEDVGKAGREGDPAANAIIKASGELMGQVLASLVNFFNPSHIILGGGVTNIGYLLLASIRHAVYQRSLPLSTRHLTIEYSSLGGQVGVAGAVALAWQEVFRPSDARP